MNGGDLRRENHSLSPTSITNPLQVKWIADGCTNLDVPAGGPVVLDDRVIQCFVHGVRCVDRTTGGPIWTWPCPDTELYYTPAYDADRNVIYICRMDGSTVCLSVQTGQVLWYFYENNAGSVGQFCSPVYMGGKIYVGNGGSGFCCLDPDTHQVVWRFDFTAYLGYYFRDGVCTPACDNGYIYFTTRTGQFFCLRASDGSCVWHVYKQCWRQNALLLSDNYVYAMNNQADVECRNRSDGSLVWSTTLTGTTDGNLAICGDLLIVPGDSWRIWGINRHTGAQVWCTRLTGNFARNTPFVACGKVYISACHGDYYGLDGQTGAIEWRYHHGVEYTFVDCAEADGNLFVACRDGRIFCFEPVTPGDPAACVCNLNATPLVPLTPTFTWTPTSTPTQTPTSSTTPTPTETATQTPTSSATSTPTETATQTPTDSATPTPTETATDTPTATATPTPGPDCTLTQGYWKNHSRYATQLGQAVPWPLSEDTLLCGMTWYQILQTDPQGNAWMILAHQWIAAKLNEAKGASVPPGVQAALSQAQTLLAAHCASLPPSPATDLSTLLDEYNNGILGPGHCTEDSNVASPMLYPNPWNGHDVEYLHIPGRTEPMDVKVKILTVSYREVGRAAYPHLPPQIDPVLDLKGDRGMDLSNGLYYVVTETNTRGMVRQTVQKLLILR